MELTRWLPICDDALSLLRGLHHGESFFHGVRHGLLAVNVFAGGAGVFENLAVLVVHHGDDDGVDIFAVEDGAIVAGGGNAGIADGFLRGNMAAVVKIADRDAFNPGNLRGSLQQFASANARADAGEAHGIAGRDRAGRSGRQQMRLQNISRDRRGGESSRTDVDEFPTRQRILRHEFPPAKLRRSVYGLRLSHTRGERRESIFLRMRGASFGNGPGSARENHSVRHA